MIMTGTGRPAALRVAVVGAGLISRYHLDALASLPDVEIAALVARDADRAAPVAAEYGIPLVLGDWRDLADIVDAAVIATPDDTHLAIARGLTDAGVAVLVQKPLAPSAAEAQTLLDLAAAGRVSASFMHRHFDALVALERLIADGELGEIMSARIRNATPGPDWSAWFFEAEGPIAGVAGQLGVHGIDLVQHLLGRIRTVQAASATRKPLRVLRDGSTVRSRVPDHVHAIYRLDEGMLVSHEQVWAEAGGTDRFRMEVHGTAASAILASPLAPLVVHHAEGRSDEVPIEREPVLGGRHHAAWLASVSRGEDDGTVAAAWSGLRVAEAIAEAAASGDTVLLPSSAPAPEADTERSTP